MSIYGAMFSGVSGLAAQSQALGMISDNISNVNTVGYKGTRAQFQTLVTEAASRSYYSPGGVRSTPFQMIDRQGLLQGSSSPTDIALVGSGFFVVNEAANPGTGNNYLFTRAGNFTTDASGNLTANGYFLQGWRLDSTGNLPASSGLLQSLETVNVSNLTGTARPTTSIELALNLPANDVTGTTHDTSTQIFDKQGATQILDMTWAKSGANTWTLLGNLSGTGNFASDDTTGATFASASTNYFPTATLADTTNFSLASATGNINGAVGAFTVNAPGGAPPNSATITVTVGGVPFTATVPTVAGNDLDNTSTLTFTDGTNSFTLDLGGSTTYDLDVAGDRTTLQNNLDAAFASVAFNNNATNGVPLATVTFNADGTLGSVTGTAPYGSTNASSQLQFYVDYDNNAATTSTQDRQLVTVDLGTLGLPDGVTQYAGTFATKVNAQDGLTYGSFTGISIGEDGIVTALFDNGEQRDIFKLPVATFRNPNGLQPQNANAYQTTIYSGDPVLLEANTGGAGKISPSSLESSTVDLATEFTNMIITQRAYSASAKVITTADDMLNELIQIRR
ncbi:MAG: flagellar hook protein FlgE [Pseudomonadota bacterium]